MIYGVLTSVVLFAPVVILTAIAIWNEFYE